MQQSKGPEFPEPGTTTLSRSRSRSCSTSLSSDSQLSRIHLLAPPPVNPPPSFIAPSAASQIITTDQEFNAADFVADDDDEDDSGASAVVTADALSALNGFLDHLLFNILAAAKSTQLSSIRPAVAEVLKPRLAKEVVSVADEELNECLGGPEDEQLDFRGGAHIQNGDFDLIRTWKLTRLRCMVYTRLGDMEEDDEEEYISQEGLTVDEGVPRRFTNQVGNITPAAAIFLTSIIEHIGEQALVIAGETARSRLSSKFVVEDNQETEAAKERGSMNRLVIEELDVEKLALNPTLGRLWRTWRKRTRTPHLSRMASRDSIIRRGTIANIPRSRKSSFSVADDVQSHSTFSPPVESQPDIDPASIPLPMNENDIQEIENLMFSSDIEGGDVQTMEAVVAHKVRPRSLMVLTLQPPKSASSNTTSPVTSNTNSSASTRHTRSRSLPSAPCPPEVSETDQSPERPSPTSSEERRRLETMYESDEREETRDEQLLEKENVSDQKVEALPAAVEPSLQASKDESLPYMSEMHGGLEQKVQNSDAQEITEERSLYTVASEVMASSTTSTTTNSEASSTFFIEQDDEVMGGQGMREMPILTSPQRPNRKASTDYAQNDEQSAYSSHITSERAVRGVSNDPPEMQRQNDTATMRPVAGYDAVKEPDAKNPVTEPSVREIRQSAGSTSEKGPRPVSTSDESARSSYSRSYSRPSPLMLTNGSQHRTGVSASSSGTERSAVQRISGRPSISVASSTYSKPRRSDSFSSHREKRPVTAGSTTSQVSSKLKGLIARPSESNSPRLRSSSDTSRASGATGDSCEDKSPLDELIRSEETIHYTLTPRSVREMDLPDTSRWQSQRSNTTDLADFLKNTGPEDTPWSRTSTTSSRGTTEYQTSSKYRNPDFSKQSPIHTGRMAIKPRSNPGQARDARPSVGSSYDFAQFIRNSGPDAPTNSSDTAKSPSGSRFSDATDLPPRPSRAESAVSSITRSTRLQARPAAVPRGELTSDLIDFIREGPPTVGTHRIPRTVAPFRSTMDSDDLHVFDAPSVTSIPDESLATKSQVSLGSRTGLLDSTTHTDIWAGPTEIQSSTSIKTNVSDDSHPKRTQRRVRDPYAVDWDDDEFKELVDEPKPKREEESLIDFLRNVPPPPATEAQPRPFVLNNAHAKTAGGGFGSASGMKARLLRNTSFERVPSLKASRTSLRQKSDQYSMTSSHSNYSVKVGMERQAGAMRGLPSISNRQTETSALAEFLRNTGPPDPPVSRVPPPVKDSSLSRRLFVRRKKVEV